MKTKNIPFYEFSDGIFEIDEFDCVSVFVIVGEERALVLDTGTGIGDLRWVIENRITDKPYDVLITHKHGDHIGGAGFFEEVWVHEADRDWGRDFDENSGLDFRKSYADIIRRREGRHYPYTAEKDITPWERQPVKKELQDGQIFDLGGRKVTVFHCPGHTAGECVVIDDKSRILFAGDACNQKFLLTCKEDKKAAECIAAAAEALEKIYKMNHLYDAVYNAHHDFRGFGAPLSPQVLPNVLTCLQKMRDKTAEYIMVPDDLFPDKDSVKTAVWKDVRILNLL